jgi:hypothetical protein
MEKINYLMKKYGLTQGLAEDVWLAYNVMKPADTPNVDNSAALEMLRQAKPVTKPVVLHIVETLPKITKVVFVVKGVNICIDDPIIIERLRQAAIADFVDIRTSKGRHIEKVMPPDPKRNRGRQEKKYLKMVAMDLANFKEGTNYEKHAFAGRVFAEFDSSYAECKDSNEELAHKIRSLIS